MIKCIKNIKRSLNYKIKIRITKNIITVISSN